MMKLISTIILVISFIYSFIGCTRVVEVPVYVEATCPKLVILKRVPDLNGTVGDPFIVDKVIHTAKSLRRSEDFYRKQLTNYNKKFVDKDE